MWSGYCVTAQAMCWCVPQHCSGALGTHKQETQSLVSLWGLPWLLSLTSQGLAIGDCRGFRGLSFKLPN